MKRSGPLRRTGFAPAQRSPKAPQVFTPVRNASTAVMGRVDGSVNAVPKQPRDENPNLLAMANGKPCLLLFSRLCRGDDGTTTVACHKNRLDANKGMGYKAHDWQSVWGCFECHKKLDNPEVSSERIDAVVDVAWTRQLREWRAIADSPTARYADRTSAKWALERAVAYLSRRL